MENKLDKINADRITNLEKVTNDHQQHMYELLTEIKGQKPNGNGNAAWVRQSIGITIAIVALLGFMIPTFMAVVEPIKLQQSIFMKSTSIQLDRLELHMLDGHPQKVEQQLLAQDRAVQLQLGDIAEKAIEVDIKLQHETEANRRVLRESLDNLDEKLQMEIKHVQDGVDRMIRFRDDRVVQ